MLTTPARSDHRPPRPASMIGVVAISVAAMVPDEVEVVGAGDQLEHASSSRTAATRRTSSQKRGSRRFGAGPAGCATPVAVAGTLMPAPPPRSRWRQGSGDRLLLEPDAVAADELVGDDHRQHDDALGDRHDVGRDPDQDLQRVGLLVEVGEEQRADGDPDRVVAAEQRDRDAGEAQPGLERRAVVVALAEEDRQPDQAGHGARDQHREDDHPGDVDAAGRRRGGRAAGGPQVEAEPGLVEHEPVEEADERRR